MQTVTTDHDDAGGWQLDRTAARAYQDHLVPAIFEPLARRLVAMAAVGPGDRVLDVACGTGVVARAAARTTGPSGRVLGIDVNAGMVEVARAVSPGDLDFRVGDLADLDVLDDRFDVVTCQQAVQFLADPSAGVAEMRRVVVPGGRVAFSVFRGLGVNPVYGVFREALLRHAGPGAAAMIASPFALDDADVLRTLAEDAGLDDVTVRIAVGEERFPSVAEFVAREAASSPLSGELARLDPDRRTGLVHDLETALADHVDDLGLVFSNDTYVVTGTG